MEDAKSRLRRVLGEEGLARLDAACVMVVGVGGVGSSCAEALARGGVGSLVLVDGDEVQPSNINRQAIAFVSTVGRRKVDVMAAMARDINPDVRVVTRDEFVLPEGVPALFAGLPRRPDYVVDAVDTVATKLALAAYAQDAGLRLVASMGGANKSDPTRLRFADVYDTRGDALARSVRKQARGLGIRELEVLYSDEPPLPVEVAADAPRAERPELGTMSYFPPIMGQILAGRVIQALLRG
ncbi:MAG: tRNA threonylcarbamoyladenosine dehydratase [Eggerthellaceae bacterium]|nr:tRNA threonylcarbamoyladenosine dehydratase [Eggerthellaceae bacterium]